MDTQLTSYTRRPPGVELDLIADLACPWSYLGKRRLERALDHLQGVPHPILRWHGLPLLGPSSVTWQEHLTARLPQGTTVAAAQSALQQAGSEFGIRFDFDALKALPDTHEAHRLVSLAARAGRQSEVIDALFSGFFERGQDIASHEVLARIAEECQLDTKTREAFADRAAAREDVSAEEQRMRGLGISGVPSLLINGRVLVPGVADVDTYVQALDQALFPQLPTSPDKRGLH
jgi:predicted DsbA family dithiol-disulfide isomerase